MGTHPIFESDFDCLTELKTWRGTAILQRSRPTTMGLALVASLGTMVQRGLSTDSANYTELVAIHALYADPSAGYAGGFTLNGEKYTFLRIEGDQLLGKSKGEGKNPVCIHKTNQALVIAVG